MNPNKQAPETLKVATPTSNSRLNLQAKNINFVQRNIKRAGKSKDKATIRSHRENQVSSGNMRNMLSPQLVKDS
jgi:hypothetical protein